MKMLDEDRLVEHGDMCFYKGKLLSLADDCILNTYKIKSSGPGFEPKLEKVGQLELTE